MNLDLMDLDSESQIDELSIKQLKVILKKNCIDFKGCVEKQELTDRVKRLWLAKIKEKGKFRLWNTLARQCKKVCSRYAAWTVVTHTPLSIHTHTPQTALEKKLLQDGDLGMYMTIVPCA